jgi:PAS domain S-box-containing protein
MSPFKTGEPARGHRTAPGNGRLVLLVDDDPGELRLMGRHLSAAGFGVRTANGASEALEAARQQRPDAIISDVRMTELDGFMLCSVFRSDGELGTVPIMLVTGFIMDDDDHKLAVSAGAVTLVERSADFRQELDALLRMLDRATASDPTPPAWQPEPYARRLAHQMAHFVTTLTVRNRELVRTVDELKRAEDARRQLAAIVESSDDGIVTKRRDGTIVSWNAGAERLYGYGWDEAVGQHLDLIVPEECRQELADTFAAVERGEGGRHFETVRRRKDGSLIDVAVTASAVLDASGAVIGASTISYDITQRKRTEQALHDSEARFHQLADAMPQFVWTADRDGHVDYGNHRAYEFTGLVEGDGRIRFRQFIHPDDEQECRDQWHRSVRTGQDYVIEYRFKDRQTRGYRWFLGRALAVRNAEGAIEKWFGTCTDIDDQKRLQEALEAAKRDAERASLMKDQFLMTVSHELRTPLNVIYGWTRMLKSQSPTIDREKALNMIEQYARLQDRLVDDLLDLSQGITGQLRVERRSVSVQSIVEEAVAAVRPTADAKGVALTAASGPRLVVSADPVRLHQVMWNLLTNAVKFTPRGGRVDVVATPSDRGVSITVRDTGIGMAREFLPYAFDRFRQADQSTTRGYGGLGLGLAIVRHLIELHGGTVSVTSEVGTGSSFVVTLPACPDGVAASASDNRAAVDAEPDRPTSIAGLRVLIVDNDVATRDLLFAIITEYGGEGHLAETAEMARRLLSGAHFDVLVADVEMPGEDGLQLIRGVRQSPDSTTARIPAVAVSAYARSEDRTRALSAGFQMYLSKPVEPSELAAVVMSVARRPVPAAREAPPV